MKPVLLWAIFLLLLTGPRSWAQVTQVIRGTVTDRESHQVLPGATLKVLSETGSNRGMVSDEKGAFRFTDVPVGRYTLRASFPGYQTREIPGLILNSGKELVVSIELEESVTTLEEVQIVAGNEPGGSNEMAVNSARSFQMEETERFAGSRSDAARMASNFAGVNGADDSRNDISVRGNSPLGLLWRIEGVDVLNPNHFAVPGTTGGAISLLNNKLFGTSDFYTGAFPAEYGNATAAVFDIRLRNGNTEKHEYSAQLGILGTEISGEGPLSSRYRGSYLFAYRYSTLRMFETLNLKIGTDAVPNYQDLSFKFYLPAGKAGIFSLWGVSGTSAIRMMLSEQPADEVDLYSESDWNQRFKTRMAVGGVTHQISLGTQTWLRTTLAHYAGQAIGDHERFVRDSAYQISRIFPKVYFDYQTQKTTLHTVLNTKLSARHSLRFGVMADRFHLQYLDSNFVEPLYTWEYRNNYKGSFLLLQGYAQWKFKPVEKVQIQAGIHAQHFTLSNSTALEPRAGIRWQSGKKTSLSLSTGWHSQMLPLYLYVNQKPLPGSGAGLNGSFYLPNSGTGFTRSQHTVLGFDFRWTPSLFMRVETYYQYQYRIPVTPYPSAFSLLNQGTSFTRYFPDRLVNTGIGQNYGIEFTLNKSFTGKWYALTTVSLYQAEYKGSDGKIRPADLNGRYIWNILWGREWKPGKKENRTITTAIKSTLGGGRRYTPADRAASDYLRELVEIDSLTNTLQFRDYYRLDFRIGYRVNRPKVTHEVMVDILNILDTRNILALTYVPDPANPAANPFRESYQLGRLPLFWYRLDF